MHSAILVLFSLAVAYGAGIARKAPTKKITWPENTVPYEFESQIDGDVKGAIEAAMKEMQEKTCVKFVEKTDQSDYVSFTSENPGCYSYLGRVGGEQPVNLQTKGCAKKGVAQREIMHALGFPNEQNRMDRDEYIKVNLENVLTGLRRMFDRSPAGLQLGAYDYGSIMHNSEGSFAKESGLKTIEALKEPETNQALMGQTDGMSDQDVAKIKEAYGC